MHMTFGVRRRQGLKHVDWGLLLQSSHYGRRSLRTTFQVATDLDETSKQYTFYSVFLRYTHNDEERLRENNEE